MIGAEHGVVEPVVAMGQTRWCDLDGLGVDEHGVQLVEQGHLPHLVPFDLRFPALQLSPDVVVVPTESSSPTASRSMVWNAIWTSMRESVALLGLFP